MTGRLMVVAAVSMLVAGWAHVRPQAVSAPPADFAAAVPLVFGEWIGRDAPPLDPAVARVLAADEYVHRYYGWRDAERASRGVRTADGDVPHADRGSRIADVETDIAYYARPQAGAAMHSPLACLPGNGWQVVESGSTPLVLSGRELTLRRLTIRHGTDRLAMNYWFQNRSAIVGNEYAQRLQLLTNGLTGRATDAALVRVMAHDTPDGRLALDRFTRDLAALLTAAF